MSQLLLDSWLVNEDVNEFRLLQSLNGGLRSAETAQSSESLVQSWQLSTIANECRLFTPPGGDVETPPTETNPAAERQQSSINMLAEWSRWLIAVGVVAAAGCVAVLKMGAEGTQRDELVRAVGCFLISMALAAILGFVVAWVKSEPPTDRRRHCVWLFAIFQLAALALGGVSLYSWVRNVGIADTPPLAEPSEDVRANVRAILGDELIRIGQELQKPETAPPVRRPRSINIPGRGSQ